VSVVVVGLNHHTVPLSVLESVAVGEADLPKALHDLLNRDHLSEAVVVSTCMRTEVYAEVGRFHGAIGDIRNFLSDWSGHPPEVLSDHIYDFYDDAAVRHLLRVASGLDSVVLGEGEILRQVRRAWDVARVEGASRTALGNVFRQALETGKRVRTDTAIARGTTSLSHTAISLAGSVGAPLTSVPPDAAGCPVIGHGVARETAQAARPDTATAPVTGGNVGLAPESGEGGHDRAPPARGPGSLPVARSSSSGPGRWVKPWPPSPPEPPTPVPSWSSTGPRTGPSPSPTRSVPDRCRGRISPGRWPGRTS
jgi:hypothetical protein